MNAGRQSSPESVHAVLPARLVRYLAFQTGTHLEQEVAVGEPCGVAQADQLQQLRQLQREMERCKPINARVEERKREMERCVCVEERNPKVVCKHARVATKCNRSHIRNRTSSRLHDLPRMPRLTRGR